MNNKENISGCGSCRRGRPRSGFRKKSGLWSTFLLVLLPKCPFCIMAYTSTLMLCTKEETLVSSRMHTSSLTIGLILFFCALTIFSITLNYRGNRTKYALLLALTGSILCIISAAYGGGTILYYTGTAIIFSGIWLNGSMLFFINKLKNLYKKPAMQGIPYP